MARFQRLLRQAIVLSSALIFLLACGGLIFWAAPKLRAMVSARSAPDQERALSRLRAIAEAQASFWGSRPEGEERFGDFSELVAGGFFKEVEAKGQRDDGLAALRQAQGFRYTAAPSPTHPGLLWWATAEDVKGGRYFYLNQGGVLYAADAPIRPRSESNTEPDRGIPIGVR